MRKLNNTPRKKSILRLRGEGKSFGEIHKTLGCSKSVISYHCGNGNEKARVKAQAKLPICKKISSFKSRCSKANYQSIRSKLKTFKRRSNRNGNLNNTIVNNVSKNYSCQEVIDKIGKNPICYLTGKKINLKKPETYHLDHITPTSKGGTNDLSNLGVCLKEANQAKGDLTIKQLRKLCGDILAHIPQI
tara:strand:- start:3 stop:569 length:567 start_codon:yes stop_codon:yes gene_type:complete